MGTVCFSNIFVSACHHHNKKGVGRTHIWPVWSFPVQFWIDCEPKATGEPHVHPRSVFIFMPILHVERKDALVKSLYGNTQMQQFFFFSVMTVHWRSLLFFPVPLTWHHLILSYSSPVLALPYLPVSVRALRPDRKSECVPPLPTAKYIPQTLLHPLVNSVVLVSHLCSVLSFLASF